MSIEPGQTCPECKRRVPHPKKPSSPKTKVFAVRVPVDEIEAFTELIDVAARHLAAQARPHHRFWALHYALVCLLQSEEFAGALAPEGA